MATAIELIKSSMRKLGVLSQGETPQAEESKDALESLNTMLDSWSTQRLAVLGTTIEEFTLVNGQTIYTMGTGGDFNTTVPVKTSRAYIRDNTNVDLPVQIIDHAKYGRLPDKNQTATFPQMIYIDNNYPLRNVYVYPTPSETNTLIFHNDRQLSNLSALTTVLSLPVGYKRAIIYNLAIELAPEYGVSISAELAKAAKESLEAIKRANIRAVEVGLDPAITQNSEWDWRTGD